MKYKFDLLSSLVFLLTGFFLLETIFSLGWRLKHDAALMQYVAFLITEKDKLPYKDIFSINLPGTHLFYCFWIKVFGYSDLGFRLLDIIWSGLILTFVYLIVRPAGRKAAVASITLTGIVYLSFSPTHALQREWIMLLPIMLSVWLIISVQKYSLLRLFVVGFLSGWVFLIKPHAIIYLPVLYIFYRTDCNDVSRPQRRGSEFILLTGIGFVSALAPAYVYIIKNGLERYFLDIVFNYWRLYAELSGGHYVMTGLARYKYLVEETLKLGGNTAWIFAGFFGLFLFYSGSRPSNVDDRRIKVLGSLVLLFAVYPTLSGQFWWYHWLPCLTFTLMLIGSTVLHQDVIALRENRIAAIIVICLSLLFGARIPVATDFIFQITGQGVRAPNSGRADEIAEFLSNNLRPGDKVQPLDWTGGGVHGCLIARADIATSFVWDAHFYHHVDHPYICRIRQRFIDELYAGLPRFIIDVYGEDKPWPAGDNTSREFPLLKIILKQYYEIATDGAGYRILEINSAF